MDRERIGSAETTFAARLLWAALFLATVPTLAAELTFPPGSQLGGDGRLAIGDSLRVGAKGLPPGGAADLRLIDPLGAPIAELRLRADAQGDLPLDLLWWRTGVVGCDCRSGADKASHRFSTFEEAEWALSGTRWTVELVAADGATVLARRALLLEPTRDFRVYASDPFGCPRHDFAPAEDVYLTFHGPRAPRIARVFLVPDRPAWVEPMPLAEVRPYLDTDGEVIQGLFGPLATYLAWPGDPKAPRAGYFAFVVRTEDVENAEAILEITDHRLAHLPADPLKSTEEGIRINDWDCGPPRH